MTKTTSKIIIRYPDTKPDFMDGYIDDFIPDGMEFDCQRCANRFDDELRERVEKRFPGCTFEWIDCSLDIECEGIDPSTIKKMADDLFVDGEPWLTYREVDHV